ncbi:MAG TPA: hypothetical protein VNV15_10345 [Opitutaceae bacterium]|jgi:hypothetical protein|nr:hypothetical protein [Opitutaceae bacterium]
MPTLTLKVPAAMQRELKKTAKKRGVKVSAFARAALEAELHLERPGSLVGRGRGLLVIPQDYDPEAPVFATKEWAKH